VGENRGLVKEGGRYFRRICHLRTDLCDEIRRNANERKETIMKRGGRLAAAKDQALEESIVPKYKKNKRGITLGGKKVRKHRR